MSFVNVLKRFGDPAPLSFPTPGWTLSVVPIGGDLARLRDELDDFLLEGGGRIYPVKNSRLTREKFQQMYQRLDEWKKVRTRWTRTAYPVPTSPEG